MSEERTHYAVATTDAQPPATVQQGVLALTRENYHSREAGLAYWSNSQYADFLECPARALAACVSPRPWSPLGRLSGRRSTVASLGPWFRPSHSTVVDRLCSGAPRDVWCAAG